MPTTSRAKRVLIPALVSIGALLTLPAITAVASPGNADNVSFCHATASETNPYRLVTTDPASIIRAGHTGHSGDIIPAFDYAAFGQYEAGSFPGQNLQLLEVLSSGCRVPATNVPPTPTEGPPTPAPEPTQTEPEPEPTEEPTEEPVEPTVEPVEPTEQPSAEPTVPVEAPTTAPTASVSPSPVTPPVVVAPSPTASPRASSGPSIHPASPTPSSSPISGVVIHPPAVMPPPTEQAPGAVRTPAEQQSATRVAEISELPFTGPVHVWELALAGLGLVLMGAPLARLRG